MKNFLILAFVFFLTSAWGSVWQGQQGVTVPILAGNSAGTVVNPTPGSFVSVPLAYGANAVSITVTGTWAASGGISVWTTTAGFVTVLPSSIVKNRGTGDYLGVVSGAAGTWDLTVNGAGALMVVVPSAGFSGMPTITVSSGPGGGNSAGIPGASVSGGNLSTWPLLSRIAVQPTSLSTGTDWTPSFPIRAMHLNLASGTGVSFQVIHSDGSATVAPYTLYNGIYQFLVPVTTIKATGLGSLAANTLIVYG